MIREFVGSRRVRRALLGAGTALIFVGLPTVFALFPGLTALGRVERVFILFGWFLVGLVGALFTAEADRSLHRELDAERAAVIRSEHRANLRDHFQGILDPHICGLPDQYHLTVFVPVDDFLVPVYPAAIGMRDPTIFPNNAGAVGKAWKDPSRVFAETGEAVSSALHNLTEVQQRMYKMFNVVAAVVIEDDDGKPTGVLGAIARDDEEGRFFDVTAGGETLRQLAMSVSWLLPAAKRWLLPTPDDQVGES
jgi:hypothetical protein